jgi:2-keto-3-deoxy-L-rhamnonate aldolase RhmA|tara:strand:- start:3096 stop:3935 length:840 start_codon:yes stop_codon:yes gene_type:complete
MFRKNRTKARLNNGKAVQGIVHGLADPQVAEMIGLAGYDFIVIDGEHGSGGMQQHLACLQAVAATPTTAIIRVASNDEVAFKHALDLGAEGVLVPDVRTVAEAKAAVDACFYPPRGKRGFSAPTVRASDYSININKYMANNGDDLLICLMIESAEGVANAKQIAKVKGVDVVQLGPFDLSCDLGIPGQFEHPKFTRAMAEVEKATLAAGKILGGVPLPGLPLEEVLARDYLFITMGVDVPMLSEALTARIDGFSNLVARVKRSRNKTTPAKRKSTKKKR